MSQTVQVGQPAPSFTAPVALPGETAGSPVRSLSLADYAGRWLVFFWYPADFTTVCPTEITALSDRMDEFADVETGILGASTDSVHAHRVWMGIAARPAGHRRFALPPAGRPHPYHCP